jgi:uncharacterized protein YndB with AHSA1/START domain
MTTTHAPTGRREIRDGIPHLVLTRTFAAPVEAVWASVTEADRLARWIGTWRGDPADGRVEFAMTYDDMPFEPYVIEVCQAPTRLRVRSENPDPTQNWTLDLSLAQEGATTTLQLAQVVEEHTDAADVGPGWEYQLDRLEAHVRGEDVSAVVWETFLPLREHYARAF